jgi:hypothetical protein
MRIASRVLAAARSGVAGCRTRMVASHATRPCRSWPAPATSRWNPTSPHLVLPDQMNAIRARGISILLPALAVALAACAAPGAGEPSVTPSAGGPTDGPSIGETLPPSTGAPASGEVPSEIDAIVAAILADAAERTGVPEEAIEVVQAEAVTWSDGSMDCPEPGMLYTQALVDGFHVIVDADGEELDYRSARGGSFLLCENGRPAS